MYRSMNGLGDCKTDWEAYNAAKAAYPGKLQEWQQKDAAGKKAADEYFAAEQAYEAGLKQYNDSKAVCDSMFADYNTRLKAFQTAQAAHTTAVNAREAIVKNLDATYAKKLAQYKTDYAAWKVKYDTYRGLIASQDHELASVGKGWADLIAKNPSFTKYQFPQRYYCGGMSIVAQSSYTKSNYEKQCRSQIVIKGYDTKGLGAYRPDDSTKVMATDPCILKLVPVTTCSGSIPVNPGLAPVAPKALTAGDYPPAVPTFTATPPNSPACSVPAFTMTKPVGPPEYLTAMPKEPVAPSCDPNKQKKMMFGILFGVLLLGGAGYATHKHIQNKK